MAIFVQKRFFQRACSSLHSGLNKTPKFLATRKAGFLLKIRYSDITNKRNIPQISDSNLDLNQAKNHAVPKCCVIYMTQLLIIVIGFHFLV